MLAIALASTLAPLSTASAAPVFKAPFPCGQSWTASTYGGHSTGNHAVDFNRYPGQSDLGQPAIASAAGTARHVWDTQGGGNLVIIDHGGGWVTWYAHLATVGYSNPIEVGEQIGTVGDTGSASSAPHLHYEQRFNGQAQPVAFDGQQIAVGTTYGPGDPTHTSTNCGASTPPVTGNSGTALTGVASGRCIEAAGGGTANGTRAQIWDCNGSAAQQWHYVNGQLRVYGNPTKCLDADAGTLSGNGTKVQVWDCLGDSSNQQWTARSDGSIVSVGSGRCLDATDGGTANGTLLQLYDCNGTGAQRWIGSPAPNQGPTIINAGSGRCLDVDGSNIAPGTAVQLWDCNSSAAQQMTVSGGAIRVFLDKCLDITNASFNDGTAIQTYPCNGTPAQAWTFPGDGTIRNPHSGKCLDARNGATVNGTRLQLWTCAPTPAQQFYQPVVPPAPPTVTATALPGSAVVSWTAPPPGTGPAPTSYRITRTPGGQAVTIGPSGRSTTMAGLDPGATYSFSVSAVNGYGASVAATSAPVTIPGSPPSPPPNGPAPTPSGATSAPAAMRLSKVVVRGRKAIVRWTSVPASATQVVVDLSKGKDRTTPVSLRKLVLKRLNPGRYKVRIAARNDVGTSPFSAWVRFRVR